MEKKIPKPSSKEKTDHRQKSEDQDDIKLSGSNTGNRVLIIVKNPPLFCFQNCLRIHREKAFQDRIPHPGKLKPKIKFTGTIKTFSDKQGLENELPTHPFAGSP